MAAMAMRIIGRESLLDLPLIIRFAINNSVFKLFNMNMLKYTEVLRVILFIGLVSATPNSIVAQDEVTAIRPIIEEYSTDIVVGAAQFDQYLNKLNNKAVAVVGNQTTMIGNTHLVDTLLSKGVNLVKVFAPEHGFRGTADAGEHVQDSKDINTGLPIVSLYGSHKKPTATDLNDVDVVIFDMQDVGARFYTYISTMTYVMEACAENDKEVLILDRPNPNGHYVDGPVLEDEYSSFVGMHPVPIVHGMTIGEYAQMVNGEGWLNNGIMCDLTVVTCQNYTHNDFYKLPVQPSPNLPNMASVYLYPSLCLFEGTTVSVGRGTDNPFQIIGHPDFSKSDYSFTPQPNEGASKPKYNGELCYGYDLAEFGEFYIRNIRQFYIFWLIGMFEQLDEGEDFFRSDGFFNLLAGNNDLEEQILNGATEAEIRKSWEPELTDYKEMRKQYLLYPDFE